MDRASQVLNMHVCIEYVSGKASLPPLGGWVLAGWLASWLVGWLVGWLAGWLVSWCWSHPLAGWLVGLRAYISSDVLESANATALSVWTFRKRPLALH
ncbi:hypothetical protein M0802_004938 [Mischocyttarus mexicanus]|nr:hypothetical protein M0802_004938 [Mischocyttarus mexicanus]